MGHARSLRGLTRSFFVSIAEGQRMSPATCRGRFNAITDHATGLKVERRVRSGWPGGAGALHGEGSVGTS